MITAASRALGKWTRQHGLSGFLLSEGNSKIGKIHSFSLPAGHTCPGRTEACESVCYAKRGRYRTPTIKNALGRSMEAVKSALFVMWMLFEIGVRRVRTLRIHVSGDFYSAAYARRWTAIVRRAPDVTFYLYTRSWRVPEIRKVLDQLSELPNVRVWYSVDRDTGRPTHLPKRVRLAYLQLEETERVPGWVDLVFRDTRARKGKAIRINGVLVCPMENGKNWHGGCDKCTLCIADLSVKDPRKFKKRPEPEEKGRVPLRLVG